MLLDLSLVFLSEHETINKSSIKASKFTTPRALSINKQVYLTFAGNYTDDNTQSDAR